MSGVIENISVVQKFLNILTWKKILQLFVFFFLIGTVWISFENRMVIYDSLGFEKWAKNPNHNLKLSKISVSEIDAIVIKSELIIGVQIAVVDFNNNTRLVVYSTMDDENLKRSYDNFMDNSVGNIPLFNSDTTNNVRISQLINGEFICNNFKETIEYKISPSAESSVNTICSNGIPPYYGKFAGIITLYLKRAPTKEDVDQLRNLSKSTAKLVFERDFQ